MLMPPTPEGHEGKSTAFHEQNLIKSFYHRSKLKNSYNKNPTEMNKTNYKRQRNFCVNLLKREKRKEISTVIEILKVWAIIKHSGKAQSLCCLISRKSLQKDITIVDKDNISSKNNKVAEKLNNFFYRCCHKSRHRVICTESWE